MAAWTETVIHNLGSIDGHPGAPLTMDSHGNLYGTGAGFSGEGAVFELLPGPNGSWTEVILHQFRANGDGSGPGSAVTLDSSDILYGTTSSGGEYGRGRPLVQDNPYSNAAWRRVDFDCAGQNCGIHIVFLAMTPETSTSGDSASQIECRIL